VKEIGIDKMKNNNNSEIKVWRVTPIEEHNLPHIKNWRNQNGNK
tara:strand:+ start:2659 stop:2790 length:132 start_codon:yes stop_codon:yes gene_type:complete